MRCSARRLISAIMLAVYTPGGYYENNSLRGLLMRRYVQFIKTKWFFFASGLALGALVILGVRFVIYQPPELVHYHANFAVYVNGQREQFKGMQYYEETEAQQCTLTPVETPNERAHMHGNVSGVVHVEDHLVTWGQFMQNVHYGLGDDYLKTSTGVFTNNDQGKLSFILNGKKAATISGKVIGDKDKLLISYGTETDGQLQQQYESVPNTAATYDTAPDPASCSGSKKQNNDRLKHLF